MPLRHPPADASAAEMRAAIFHNRFVDMDADGAARDPRDCVLKIPMRNGFVQLLALDSEGRPGAMLILPLAQALPSDVEWLRARCRLGRPPHQKDLRLIG